MFVQIINSSFKILLLILISSSLTNCDSTPSNSKKIGIIIPIEHKAMTEIVGGFTETLRKIYPYPVTFKIANAQGDLNLERSIMQQMKDERYDLIVPIATGTTDMAVTVFSKQPIVALAADFSEEDRKKLKKCHISIVHDAIPPAYLLTFIHQAYPQLTQLTLIYSPSDKIFPDVKRTLVAAKKVGIEIKLKMVSTLPELYSVTQSLPNDTQGILVLKDNLVVNGIATLALFAEKHHIPLITSDQGSVEDGAAFSLGVFEKQIGAQGATLASAILKGQTPCQLPIIEMTKFTVFINKESLRKEQQSLSSIQQTANNNHYQISFVNGEKNA